MDGLGNSDSIAVTVRLEAEPPAVPPVVIISTSRTATPTATTQTAIGVIVGSGPTPTTRPTTNSGSVTFGSVEAYGEAAPQAEGSPNLLWGLGALGLIGAVTAAVLEERRKRKEEEARQLAEAQAKAAALNAAEEQKRIQNWMNGQIILTQGLNVLQRNGVTNTEIQNIQNIVNHEGLASALTVVNNELNTIRQNRIIQQLENISEEERNFTDQFQEIHLLLSQEPVINNSSNQFGVCAYDETSASETNLLGQIGAGIDNFLSDAATTILDIFKVRQLNFNQLESGYISVSSSAVPGSRLATRLQVASDGFNFRGTRYSAESISSITSTGLIRSSVNGTALLTAGVTALFSNLFEYGWGAENLDEFSDRTLENQDFWASFAADAVMSIITGLVAALIVSAFITITTMTAPLLAVVAATSFVGAGVSFLLDNFGANDLLQEGFNILIDTVQSWFNS